MNHISIEQLLGFIEELTTEITYRIDDPYDTLEYAKDLSIYVDQLVERLEAINEEQGHKVSALNKAIDTDVDTLIKLLERVKSEPNHNKKIASLQQIARSVDGYHFFWAEKLNKYLV